MNSKSTGNKRSPWFWVPTLYYAEGIPYIVVMSVSVVMYKRLGISNADIALYTSWLYLPWVIKPLWSPIVDILKTKRLWIYLMQLLVGAAMASIALTIPVPNFFQITLAFFWLMAFSSATHDIAADGFYMLGLTQHQQAWFVGVRNTFYRLAMITGQGLLVIVAGFIESHSGLEPVEVTVIAAQKPAIQQVEMQHPDSLTALPREGDLRIITQPKSLVIPIQTFSRGKIDSLVQTANHWNMEHGQKSEFKQEPKTEADRQRLNESLSWWARHVTKPLEAWITGNFGPDEVTNAVDRVGNIGVLYFHLSKQPDTDEKIVINFGQDSGDKSISLRLGSRMVFTEKNWDQPAMAVIQLDPKMTSRSRATYDARAGNIPLSWTLTFAFMGALFVIFFIYHRFILPYPKEDVPRPMENAKKFYKEFGQTFASFFQKDKVWMMVIFLLIFRLGESQIVKLASPFLLDSREVGGLGLTTGEVGFVYGTVGLLMLTLGGLLGGFVAAKGGLQKWIWWMAIAMNLPNAVYIYLSHLQPDSYLTVNLAVGVEQFGYGFGFTAYMLYMIFVSEGKYKTSHYAICTAFMALGMMIPGMVSGWIQELIGYPNFFIWVLIATVPGFIVIKFLPLDPEFGKKQQQDE